MLIGLNYSYNDIELQGYETYIQTRATGEDSDQTAHLRSLIRFFTGCILDTDADARTDLSLRCAHMPEGTFSYVTVQLIPVKTLWEHAYSNI